MLVNHEKQSAIGRGRKRVPLTARPYDLVYFLFFGMHFIASLIIDMQYFYPAQFVPSLMKSAFSQYIDMSNDPFMGGIFGYFGDAVSAQMGWFKTFLFLEAVFQMPVFLLGLRGLYYNNRAIYPLLALYGASSATTTLACLTHILTAPETTSATLAAGLKAGVLLPTLTYEQRLMLLSSYVPFFLLPLMIAVDMSLRVVKLMKKGIKAEEEEKWK